MKTKILLSLFCSLLFWANSYAGETEPNDTKAQADSLTLNGSNSGIINPAGDLDWWKITTNADGQLNVTLTPCCGKNVWIYIYDKDGTTLLNSGQSTGTFTVSQDGLAAGDYYIRVNCYFAADTSGYTISNTLSVPAQANDLEPNGTAALAKVLPLNGSKTGHIDYYYNNSRDSADWYKVTTNADGRLRLTMSSANGQNVWAYLYDKNGTTLLGSGYTSGTAVVVNADGLAAGMYYIRVNTFYNNGFAPYTLSDSLFVPAQPNDTEPDSTRALALTLPLNGSVTGHINYYYDNHRDSADWYKVTTTADGRLRLTMSSANGQNVWAYLYDNDGITQLGAGYTAGTAVVVNTDGLAAGTYYVKVKTFYNNEWAPYTLSDSLFSPTQANNSEPDSTRALAKTLPVNGSVTGHINYYYNNNKDAEDWYKVIINGDGRLRLTMASGNGQNVWAYLYDNDGITQLAADYTAGTKVVVNADGLAAGTYYIKVKTYYTTEWAPYTLSDSLFKPAQANDTESNDTKAQATVLPLNGSKTGHTNYYYNLVKDGQDWYQLTTNADGMITITIQSHNGQNVWAYLYDVDGTTQLDAQYTTSSKSYTVDGLKQGIYYVRINTYYSYEWAPYTLSNTLSTYSYAADAEPNGSFAQGKTIPANDSVTGHVNFYYAGVTDAEDRWKINYTGVANGSMTVRFDQENRLKYGDPDPTYFVVYKDTATAPISSGYYYATSGDIVLNNLTQGYYYIKIYTYYSTPRLHFTSYKLKASFTQANVAQIVLRSSVKATTCTNGKLTFGLSGANGPGAPFKVQLYRFGAPSGAPVTVNDTTITFNNLQPGTYYATVFGDGATGAAFTTSATTTFSPPKPTGLSTTNITPYEAKLNWTGLSCNSYYKIQYHVQGESAWLIRNTPNNSSYILKPLTRNTTYIWRIASVDSANGQTLLGNYSDSVSFTTLNDTAQIALVQSTATNACTGNSLKYVASASLAPYSVQLYRFGIAYGSPLSVTDTATFNNLPPGSYYATAYGAGATGDNFGTSSNRNFAPPATSTTSETGITAVKAIVHWSLVSCANGYAVQYRKQGTIPWLQKNVLANKDSAVLTGLTAATTYQWRVASAVGVDTLTYVASSFTPIDNFTTATLFAIAGEDNHSSGENIRYGNNTTGMTVAPNPAVNSVRISYTGAANEIVSLQVKDITGKTVITRNNIAASSLSKPLDVSALNSGMYIVNIIKADKNIISTKLIIAK